MTNGEKRFLQLPVKSEKTKQNLKPHHTCSPQGQGAGGSIRGETDQGGNSQSKDRQGCGLRELAMAEDPIALVRRLKAVVNGPLAGHRPTQNTLAKHKSNSEDGEERPPTFTFRWPRVPSEALIQAAENENKQQGGCQMGCDGRCSQKMGNRQRTECSLKSNQQQGNKGCPRDPGRQAPSLPNTETEEDQQRHSHEEGVQTVKPLQKNLKIHLPTWKENSVTQGPIWAGQASLHDPGCSTDHHERHNGNHQMGGHHS